MTQSLLWNAHLAATLTMVGLIWFVQVVHYPLLARLEGPAFEAAHAFHMNRTGLVVVPPMLIELATMALLVWRPGDLPGAWLWASAGLLAGVWVSTWAAQVPLHNRMAASADGSAKASLVRTNWIRTVLWTARGAVLIGIQAGALR